MNRVSGSIPFFFAIEPCCDDYRLLQATDPSKTLESLTKFHPILLIFTKLLYTKYKCNIDRLKMVIGLWIWIQLHLIIGET